MTCRSLDARHTAVLSLDVQAALVTIYTKDSTEFLPAVASAIEHSRRVGAHLVHVRVGFRPGFPEIHARNRLLAAIKSNPEHRQIFEGAWGAIHPAAAPQGSEIVITKHRISAFQGTDLEIILRSQGIDTLVLFGIATSGVVLSTALEAVDLDYDVFVVKDCCADLDAETHRCLLERLLPQRATVLSAAEVADRFS